MWGSEDTVSFGVREQDLSPHSAIYSFVTLAGQVTAYYLICKKEATRIELLELLWRLSKNFWHIAGAKQIANYYYSSWSTDRTLKETPGSGEQGAQDCVGFFLWKMEVSPVKIWVMVKTLKEALFFVLGRQPRKESWVKLGERKYLHLHPLRRWWAWKVARKGWRKWRGRNHLECLGQQHRNIKMEEVTSPG